MKPKPEKTPIHMSQHTCYIARTGDIIDSIGLVYEKEHTLHGNSTGGTTVLFSPNEVINEMEVYTINKDYNFYIETLVVKVILKSNLGNDYEITSKDGKLDNLNKVIFNFNDRL